MAESSLAASKLYSPFHLVAASNYMSRPRTVYDAFQHLNTTTRASEASYPPQLDHTTASTMSVPSPEFLIYDALLTACSTADIPSVTTLLEAGFDIEVCLPDGLRPLHIAAIDGHTDLVRVLLSFGAQIDARQTAGITPLHFAAAEGWCGTVRALLEEGKANIDAMDHGFMTALHHAAVAGQLEVVRELVGKGAGLELRDCVGLTPVGCAVVKGQTRAVSELLRLGASVDPRDKKGRTPLHLAARFGFLTIARVLVEAGADREAVCAKGLMPSEVVDKSNAWDMINFLCSERPQYDLLCLENIEYC